MWKELGKQCTRNSINKFQIWQWSKGYMIKSDDSYGTAIILNEMSLSNHVFKEDLLDRETLKIFSKELFQGISKKSSAPESSLPMTTMLLNFSFQQIFSTQTTFLCFRKQNDSALCAAVMLKFPICTDLYCGLEHSGNNGPSTCSSLNCRLLYFGVEASFHPLKYIGGF